MELALIILVSSALIAVAEVLKRKFSLPTMFTRRFAHVTTAIVACIAPFFITRTEIVVVSIMFAVVLQLGRRYNIFSAIHTVERRTYGDIFLPLGVAGAALLFLPDNVQAFQFGVLVMGISDAMAGLIGEKYGKHTIRFFGNVKSLEGSAVFFVCTLILVLLFAPVFSYPLVMIVMVLTIVELLSVYGLDNLILPTLGAFLFQFVT